MAVAEMNIGIPRSSLTAVAFMSVGNTCPSRRWCHTVSPV